MQGRERMTKSAVSVVRKTGTAAALEKCQRLANLVNAHLVEATCERFVNASAVASRLLLSSKKYDVASYAGAEVS
jgi:hypothetical protein